MADLSPIPPLPKPPGRDRPGTISSSTPKPIRHVSFSEATPRYERPARKGRRRARSCCLCCAWTCLALVCICLVLVLVVALFMAVFRAKLPVFRIEHLRIPTFDVVASDQQYLLSADVELFIEAWNKNSRAGLSYGPLSLYVSSENVNLGRNTIPEFFQEAKNMTIVRSNTGVVKSVVDNQDVTRLKAKFNQKNMVVDVELSGALRFVVEGFKTNALPVSIKCGKVELSRVAAGIEPQCHVQMFTLGDIF